MFTLEEAPSSHFLDMNAQLVLDASSGKGSKGQSAKGPEHHCVTVLPTPSVAVHGTCVLQKASLPMGS